MRVFKIDNKIVDVSPNWGIVDKVNKRSKLTMTVTDKLTLTEINIGQSVEIANGSTRFKGIIKEVEVYEAIPGIVYHRIVASDNTAKADKRIVKEVYDNRTDTYIINDIITKYLSEEGVTAGTIGTGATITRAVFNYVSATKAMDYITSLTGYSWNITIDNKLNYFDRTSYTAPFNLQDVRHSQFRHVKNANKYRNVQYIRGGKGTTATQPLEKPSPAPDGVSRTFTLRFPLAEKPSIYINSVQVPSSDIGVNGIDTNKKWYFSYASYQITQDTTEAILTNEVLQVTYIGLNQLFGVVDNAGQINERATIETGTSGKYEFLSEEKSVTSSEQLLEYAGGLITKYAEIGDKITFKTEVEGFQVGQLLNVQKILYNINDSFLITDIQMRGAGDNVEYSITCADNASVGGWEQFFKDLISASQTFTINENDVLIILLDQTETKGRQGSITLLGDTVQSICAQIVCGFTCGASVTDEVVYYD